MAMAWDMPDIEGASDSDWPQKGSNELIQYGNVGDQPITATVQGSTLTTGFVDCRTWTNTQKTCSPSLHLVTFDLKSFPIPMLLKDRVMGLRSVLDDDKNDVVAYGLPGIASNKDGDIAVVYRTQQPQDVHGDALQYMVAHRARRPAQPRAAPGRSAAWRGLRRSLQAGTPRHRGRIGRSV